MADLSLLLISLSMLIAALVALYCAGSPRTVGANKPHGKESLPPMSDVNSAQEEA